MGGISWIKIDVGMFDNRKIRYLRKQPEGDSIVLIWIMLLTLAGRCNAGGAIFLTETVPYTPQMLADELGFDVSTIQNALDALERLNMVIPNGSYLQIAGWGEHQNIEGMEKVREQNRMRKAAQREREKAKRDALSRDSHVTVTQSHATDREKDEEKDLDGDIIPPTPSKETPSELFKRLLPEYGFSEELHGKLVEWMQYKAERRESYKETGLKSLLRQVENNAQKYGDQALCELIDLSMSNGWKGIIFDKLNETRQQGRKGTANPFLEMPREENAGHGGPVTFMQMRDEGRRRKNFSELVAEMESPSTSSSDLL